MIYIFAVILILLSILLILAMSAMGTMHIDVYPDGTEKWHIQFDGDPAKILNKRYVIFRVRKKINLYNDERSDANGTGETIGGA